MSRVDILSEDIGALTYADGLAFIERMRRQLDRFEVLPGNEGHIMNPEHDAKICRLLDGLEMEIRQYLSTP
jgi:hypothetical protein